MSREEFMNTAMKILRAQKFGDTGILFDSDNIDNYKIAQYDDDEWGVESNMPLEEFLDELYDEVIK